MARGDNAGFPQALPRFREETVRAEPEVLWLYYCDCQKQWDDGSIPPCCAHHYPKIQIPGDAPVTCNQLPELLYHLPTGSGAGSRRGALCQPSSQFPSPALKHSLFPKAASINTSSSSFPAPEHEKPPEPYPKKKLEKPEPPFPLGSLPAGFGNGEEILVMLST